MPDQRSVMKEFRALEQKRQAAGLTPEEAKRHAALRDLVGSESGASARGGFDVTAAAARLRESLLPAGLRSRPPEAGVPAAPPAGLEEAAPLVELEAAPVDAAPSPWPGPEAPPLDAGPAPWPEPVAEPDAEPVLEALAEPVAEPAAEPPGTAGEQLFDPASLSREPKPQAWNPEAPGYDPDAPYDEEAWIAAGYDPTVAYDWSAYGAGPEAQPAGPASGEAVPLQEPGDGADVAPVEASPGEASAAEASPAGAVTPEPTQPGIAEESLPFDPEAPFDHAKWFGRTAAAGGAAPGEAMAWNAAAPDASRDAALDAAAPDAPPLVLGEYDELAAGGLPAAPEGLDALAEPAPASAWPEEPGTPPGAPPSSPPAFGEYDELAAGPGTGAAPELLAAAGAEPPLTLEAATGTAVAAGAPPEGYEFLGMPGEPATLAEDADAAVEVAPAPEPPEELPGGPPLDMGEPPPEWQAESVLDQGFQLASDGSFGMLEPAAAPAAESYSIPQPVATASPAEEGWSSPPALDLAAPFEQPTLTPAEPMAAWSPEAEEPQAGSAPAGETVPPLDLGQPGAPIDLAPTTDSGLALEALEAAPLLEGFAQPGLAAPVESAPQADLAPPEEPSPPAGLPPPVDLAPPLEPAPAVEAAWPAEAPIAATTPATAGTSQATGGTAAPIGPASAAPGAEEELPTLEVEELLEEVAAEPVEPPRPLDFGSPAAEPGPAEALAPFPAESGVEIPAAAEEPLLVPVEAVAEAPLLEPIATPAPALPPLPSPVQAPPAAVAQSAPPPAASAPPPPLRPVVPPPPPLPPSPIPAPAAVVAPSRVVVHTVDGQVRRGLLSSADLGQPELRLGPQVGGAPERIPADSVKAIFFMLAPGEAPLPPQGRKVRVTFRDGRQVAGYSPDFQEGTVGFFMIPADTRTNTARIWVYQAAVRQVALS